MVVFAIWFSSLDEYEKTRVRKYQVHAVAEIVDMEYRFAGSAAILENMRKQLIVSAFLKMLL